MFFIFVLFFIVAIIILLSFIKIKVAIQVENNHFGITLILFGIIKVRKDFIIEREEKKIFALYEIKKKEKKQIVTLFDILQKTRKAEISLKKKYVRKKAIGYILKKTHFNLRLDLSIGVLQDAYATAIVCGILDAISSSVGAVYNNPKHTVKVKISPLFSRQYFTIKANGIIALTPANIIIGYVIYKNNIRR